MKAKLRDLFFQIWYWYVSNVDKNAEVRFMNFGYASEDQKLEFSGEDEANRYSIQLYHHLAEEVDLKNKSLLEEAIKNEKDKALLLKKESKK